MPYLIVARLGDPTPQVKMYMDFPFPRWVQLFSFSYGQEGRRRKKAAPMGQQLRAHSLQRKSTPPPIPYLIRPPFICL